MFTKREKEILVDIINFHLDDLYDSLMFVDSPDVVEDEIEEVITIRRKVEGED